MSRALWIIAAGRAELREGAEPVGEVVVETAYSGISRGTEALVFAGRVPIPERTRMKAPLQEGEFGFPLKYGYAAVGRVAAGPAALRGRDVFVLHPHQDRFAAPAEMCVALPEGVAPEMAVLAANMETALNAVWDSGAGPGDRVLLATGSAARLAPESRVVATDLAIVAIVDSIDVTEGLTPRVSVTSRSAASAKSTRPAKTKSSSAKKASSTSSSAGGSKAGSRRR